MVRTGTDREPERRFTASAGPVARRAASSRSCPWPGRGPDAFARGRPAARFPCSPGRTVRRLTARTYAKTPPDLWFKQVGRGFPFCGGARVRTWGGRAGRFAGGSVDHPRPAEFRSQSSAGGTRWTPPSTRWPPHESPSVDGGDGDGGLLVGAPRLGVVLRPTSIGQVLQTDPVQWRSCSPAGFEHLALEYQPAAIPSSDTPNQSLLSMARRPGRAQAHGLPASSSDSVRVEA